MNIGEGGKKRSFQVRRQAGPGKDQSTGSVTK